MRKRPDLWPPPDRLKSGQESVWDFPRPPRVEEVRLSVRVELGGAVIGESRRALRVIETSLPPGYYLPPQDVDQQALAATDRRTLCEWKGWTVYYDVVASGCEVSCGAWVYPEPTEDFLELAGYFSFYPALLDCFVGDEKARAQQGDFYGGWITSAVAGPFKGAPGSERW